MGGPNSLEGLPLARRPRTPLYAAWVARSAPHKAAGSGFVVASIFPSKTSAIRRKPLAELAWCFLHLPQLEALAVRAIDIKSAATTRRPTHWRITQLAHNTANAAHNTADRNQCAASDIGVSKDCLFSALASAKAAR